MKILIAYYSRRGMNYVDGDIVDLPVGNNEVVAGIVQRLAEGGISAWLKASEGRRREGIGSEPA